MDATGSAEPSSSGDRVRKLVGAKAAAPQQVLRVKAILELLRGALHEHLDSVRRRDAGHLLAETAGNDAVFERDDKFVILREIRDKRLVEFSVSCSQLPHPRADGRLVRMRFISSPQSRLRLLHRASSSVLQVLGH